MLLVSIPDNLFTPNLIIFGRSHLFRSIDYYTSNYHSGLKSEKKFNLGKLHCLSQMGGPEGACVAKKKFLKNVDFNL